MASHLLTLTELAQRSRVTPRTVHFYIQQGLLKPAGSPGPGAKYGEGHLARLHLIRRLQREHLPLAEIRKQLEAMDDQTIRLVASELASWANGRPLATMARPDAMGVGSALAEGTPVVAGRSAATSENPAAPAEAPAPNAPMAVPDVAMAGAKVEEEEAADRPAPGQPSASVSALDYVRRLLQRGQSSISAHDRRATPNTAASASWLARPRAAPDSGRDSSFRFDAATPPAGPAVPPVAEATPSPHAPVAERSQWERYALAPDIELHIRRPLSRDQNRQVERLLALARDIFTEELP